ncbi:zinc finger protein 638-like [Heteronotia binoei]|uniref:zinc finger protein 638-like n=1 Tax=Heteronotia binoei TaxID=13085 RepID=UPI00292F3E45|nr:zinc finger protein 638-like [Heteronotia binoei]
MDGQRSFWKEADGPVQSPFGMVNASWLPDFAQADRQQEKKLPTASEMHDYYALIPRIFPHTCSLCSEDCVDKEVSRLDSRNPLFTQKTRR